MPLKFDDFQKVANDVLTENYQCSGFQFKNKQKTTFDGAIVTTAVDLWPQGGSVQTPAKLTWKFPKPFGVAGFSVDKLEMDKDGKFKFESSADKTLHQIPDLKVDAKSDLVDPAKATAGFTFTGVADTQVKLETKPLKPEDFTFEVTRSLPQNLQVGVKAGMANLHKPDVAVRFAQGDLFASVVAKGKFTTFTGAAFYKVADNLQVAANYEQGGKNSGNFSAGVAYEVKKGTSVKVKVQQDMSVSKTVKHELSNGLSVWRVRSSTAKMDHIPMVAS